MALYFEIKTSSSDVNLYTFGCSSLDLLCAPHNMPIPKAAQFSSALLWYHQGRGAYAHSTTAHSTFQ